MAENKKVYAGQLVEVQGTLQRRGCGSNPRQCNHSISNMGCFNCILEKFDATTPIAVLDQNGGTKKMMPKTIICAYTLNIVR